MFVVWCPTLNLRWIQEIDGPVQPGLRIALQQQWCDDDGTTERRDIPTVQQ